LPTNHHSAKRVTDKTFYELKKFEKLLLRNKHRKTTGCGKGKTESVLKPC